MTVVSLDAWVGTNGPLWPSDAIVIALNICAHSSRLTTAELQQGTGSMNPAGVTRGERGGWSWVPTCVGSPARTVPDIEIIERLGAILFYSLTGQALTYPFPTDQALRTRLRSLRPELPAGIADLTIEAVSARRGAGLTLASFARDLRQALGVERQSGGRRSHRRKILISAAAASLAGSLGLWWTVTPGDHARLEANGLTRPETMALDVSAESAQTFALIDEHTAAIQMHQQIARLWGSRVAPDDPRLAWNEAHEAWVRMLAGDRLTTEQLLENKPSWLAAQLGESHPYTRASRLGLAATLDARGATAQAAALRDQAERATRAVFQDTGLATDALDERPVPPGVLAHVAPNDAEREGFRRRSDGTFSAPVTSTQRLTAGRDGWRLHLVAAGTCRASFVGGADPRRITVNAARGPDGHWLVRIEGITPAITLHAAAATRVGLSLVANGGGALTARVGQADIHSAVIDRAASLPSPPYSLAFDGEHGETDCAVVWLEIPFPRASTFNRSISPVRP